MAIILIWIHLLAAVAWIGGMVFLSLILMPVLKQAGFSGERRALFHSLARRFRLLVWASITTLLATGSVLLVSRAGSLSDAATWPFVMTLKLALVALLIALTAAHDFWLGPRVAALMQRSPTDRSTAEQRILRFSPWIARLGLILAVVILVLAVAVVRT